MRKGLRGKGKIWKDNEINKVLNNIWGKEWGEKGKIWKDNEINKVVNKMCNVVYNIYRILKIWTLCSKMRTVKNNKGIEPLPQTLIF